MNSNFPKEYTIPNPYNIPVHDQGNKNSCTAHAFALMMEYQLSDYFKERTLVDVDDLWEKQKKFGTASEEKGDLPDGPFKIAAKYGVRFKTDSGKTGAVILSGNRRMENGIMAYEGWTIHLDHPGYTPMTTIHELQQQIQALLRQLESISSEGTVSSEKIERYLSEFTQRTNTLLTVAALMSGLALIDTTYLKLFLVTSFPLFVLALFFYLLSTRRLNLLSLTLTSYQEQLLKRSYIDARKWYLATDLFLTSFFVAFTIHIYFFAFDLEVLPRDIFFSYVTALLVGGMRHFYIRAVIPVFNTNNATPEEMSNAFATGAPPDEMYFAGASAPPASLSEEDLGK